MNDPVTVLEGKGETRLLARRGLAAALNPWLTIYWVHRIGAEGGILGTVVYRVSSSRGGHRCGGFIMSCWGGSHHEGTGVPEC
jgi:hypothetical protein